MNKTNYIVVMLTESEAAALLNAVVPAIPRASYPDAATRKRAVAGVEKLADARLQPVTADPTTAKRALAKLRGQ